ncbi:unnamed protein product [Phytophthora fragariaefolia]|uniref:Unnamed protein product n=1 Tax=Phytophthora fragariaefolia TaxID=1490495 RepID=A0A9W6XC94_9STRA|nr:unnamed protein product [Phytophthora fragariaefolia]
MEDSGSRLPTRHDFPHLADAHWATLEKMVSPLGEAAFAGFPNLSAEQQNARVERFVKYESSLIAHVSAAAQEAARAAMRAEAQSAVQASATNSASFAARPTTTKPVKMSIPTFDGKASDSLVFWVREIEIALSAGQIYDAQAQVAFALSYVPPSSWPMWRIVIAPISFGASKASGRFKTTPWGSITAKPPLAGAPLSEDVKVTVFMDGVRTGPVRTELFRRQPNTFNEAVHIAMLEDHCVRSAQGHTPHIEARKGPTPMEISLAEPARPQRTQRAGGLRFGYFASSVREVSSSSASQKEQVPGTTLLCPSVAAARSNLVVVTASVKGYPEPMTVLIDSGASFNFATKASVARNNALYASALEASKSNTNVSVRLATGSIVSTRKVTIPLNVKFDNFDSVEPFIILDMDDRYDLILGMPWLAKHETWIDWRSRTIGASHNPLADRALVGHVPSSSRGGFVHAHRVPRDERQFAGSSEVLELPTVSPPRAREPEVGDGEEPQDPDTYPMGRQGSAVCNRVAFVQGTVTTQGADAETARAGRDGSVRAPPTPSVVAGSAHVEEGAGLARRKALELVLAQLRVVEQGLPLARSSGVTRSQAHPRQRRLAADSAAEDRAPQVLDVFTGEPKVGEVLTPLPTVAELLELEELSCVEFLDSFKADELAEVVLLRPEGGSLELNSSSAMDSEVLEDERTSRRQTRYGAAILKVPSDPYHPLLKESSDVVSDDPPSGLPRDRGVRHEIDLVPGTKYCTTR